jgi:hypothetical protein
VIDPLVAYRGTNPEWDSWRLPSLPGATLSLDPPMNRVRVGVPEIEDAL